MSRDAGHIAFLTTAIDIKEVDQNNLLMNNRAPPAVLNMDIKDALAKSISDVIGDI